ncbi:MULTISPECIES: AAA family ATPase [Eubacteriales]|uniref:AAA family ATPase n=1 Tax=Bittarella massiliensis (ex Durand et al. 2017) TaxID=1720313 RepID=A0AAQ1MCE1_9FIRM|nr:MULTISPECIES: AAA family ATPase [Eubacteriales]MZL68394.1 AAA family ATPase [Bittarella massiliensis (ex Durand et al. 2017)]MZL79551.1 AAA family ATPase [Bittarella massiliensis (ex Durand et al. 2017)]SHF87642.1 Adenylylsulfate kinase [Bittarella massiliensis (ex Durand et al. 2017)]
MAGRIYLITGVMAAGKSTVAQLLAERMARGVHLRGDVFRRMIVAGREEMSETPTQGALDQLALRYRLAAQAAKTYCEAGFTVVLQDNYYGRALPEMIELLRGYSIFPVVLCPRAEVVRRREAGRGKTGYTGFAVERLCADFLRETPRLGLWLDSSEQIPEETVESILQHSGGAGL